MFREHPNSLLPLGRITDAVMQGNDASGERPVVNVEVIWILFSPSVYGDERWMDTIEAVSTGSIADTKNIYEKNGKESRPYASAEDYESLE